MNKLSPGRRRYKAPRELAQSRTIRKWQSQDLNLTPFLNHEFYLSDGVVKDRSVFSLQEPKKLN